MIINLKRFCTICSTYTNNPFDESFATVTLLLQVGDRFIHWAFRKYALLIQSTMSRIPAYDSEALESLEKGMDGIHVSVRIRPLSSAEILSGIQPCCTATSNSSLVISKVGDSGAYLKSQSGSAFNFAFDAVFDETASQTDVYNKSAKPYVVKAIQGENVTIFAYGATGAGKTHTMFGSTRFDSTAAFAGAGIIPQAVADLFHLLNARIANQEKGEKNGLHLTHSSD